MARTEGQLITSIKDFQAREIYEIPVVDRTADERLQVEWIIKSPEPGLAVSWYLNQPERLSFDMVPNNHPDGRTLRELVRDGEVYHLPDAIWYEPFWRARYWVCKKCKRPDMPLIVEDNRYLLEVACPSCGSREFYYQRQFFEDMPL